MSNQAPKLDEQGNIDVDYYTKIARQERSEYIAQMAASLKAKIKSFFHVTLPKLSTSH
ncbi:hypothetical protein KFJ24_08775 [Marinobacter sediminum]|uniref:RSP_7527 family protein n=1 Tax=Marinobacter sediminum TaxID=256323 RepID=UPI002030D99A|nr:hypothetical protein [Marinobacter sediminum]MCM0612561.1 hypothetical protein [Marinobacter sediminum]